ncbi:hypothetical protein, partial [uncultured Treponema sp.]|uniref:hypothetical protein n=1 Tax=uncultured Treponema sp. TaxID=162155 RepID=UPI002614A009
LKDRAKAGFEKFSKGHDSIPGWDKFKQMAGFGGGHGASGGAGGGASAHGISGQGSAKGHEGKTLGTSSNSNFKTATKYDERTGSQRNMTRKEFYAEKKKQGEDVALEIMKRDQDRANARQNAENANKSDSSELGDKVTDGVRANK